MRLIGLILGLLLIGYWVQIADAEKVDFSIKWHSPKKKDGSVDKVHDYVLYLCDAPIISDFPKASPSGSCNGNLKAYITKKTSYRGQYITPRRQGTLYARVSARKRKLVRGRVDMVESDLSNQSKKRFGD